jgi:hypothetical protein
MPATPPTHEKQDLLLLGALFFPALPAFLLLTTFIEPKGLPWLAEILRTEPLWLVWLTRVILTGLVAAVCQFVSRPLLREFWKNRRDLADTGPSDPLERETVTGLWVSIIAFPVFGGLLASVPLMVTDGEGGVWGTFGVVLLIGGFIMLMALCLGVPRLEELHRRGAWVPPGTDRRPVLVTVALALLIMVAAGGFMLAGLWLVEHSGLAKME